MPIGFESQIKELEARSDLTEPERARLRALKERQERLEARLTEIEDAKARRRAALDAEMRAAYLAELDEWLEKQKVTDAI